MARWEPNARRRFVDAALELFEEQGYDATGVAEIATRAGLTKTTFFRHFRDKREVLFAGQPIHTELMAEAIAAMPAAATPLECVAAAVDALARSFPVDHQSFARRLGAIVGGHPDLQERSAMKSASYVRAVADALVTRGEDPLTATVAAELGLLAFHTGYSRWLETDDGPGLPELVDAALADVRGASAALS